MELKKIEFLYAGIYFIFQNEDQATIDHVMKMLGYCKLPEGEPPLLSDNEVKPIWLWWQDAKNATYGDLMDKVAQAQRDSDIKYYGGIS